MTLVVINIVKTPAESQQELVDRIRAGIDGFVSHQPGFVSATLHRALDGGHVAEVVQWASEQAWRAARERRAVNAPDRRALPAGVSGDPRLYEVVYEKAA